MKGDFLSRVERPKGILDLLIPKALQLESQHKWGSQSGSDRPCVKFFRSGRNRCVKPRIGLNVEGGFGGHGGQQSARQTLRTHLRTAEAAGRTIRRDAEAVHHRADLY